MEFHGFCRPKTIQNRSKGLPKASSFYLRFRVRLWYDFGTILIPKMLPFGRPFGAKVAPQKRSKFDLPKRAPQYAPRPPPRALKTPREAPKSLSRGAQDAPKTLHETPKGSQDPPREPKMESKKKNHDFFGWRYKCIG